MITFRIDTLTFHFPDNWQIGRFDSWVFYRKQFQRVQKAIKAVDIVAISPNSTLWLIEAKDYRCNPRQNPLSIPDQMAGKVLSTLSAFLPAKLHSIVQEESRFAANALNAKALRIALHLEQPSRKNKLNPRPIKTEDMKQELRFRLKPIDPHPLVLDRNSMGSVEWRVS